MKNLRLNLLLPLVAVIATANVSMAQVSISWGGDYVTATQSSQASLQDLAGVPTSSDSIREIGGFGIATQPAADYTGPAYAGGAQVVKFGVNSANGLATSEVTNDAGGDYISLFAQSPSGTSNSHLNYVFSMAVPSGVTYSNLTGFSGRTAGGVSGSVISRFMVETAAGIYLSNTSISGGFGGSTWSVSDLSTEQWAQFSPGSDNWRGDFASLTFDTTLNTEELLSVGWFASRDSGVAGFTNSTLTIREFNVAAVNVAAVPEPSAVALGLGLAALGLVALRRRRS
jgi:MYXO-CTERM domain-containing protein